MKRINKILIISNIVFIISLTTVINMNYKNYKNYITSEKNLATTKDKVKNYDTKIGELNKKINTKDSDKIAKVNEISTQFLNSFFNYDALSKDKIYDNIKPYSTPSLVNKLKPVKDNELESDVNYKISISNIRLYSKSIQDDNNVSVLVLADQEMSVNKVNSTTPILIELKLRNIDNKWLVDDLLINKPLKNMPFID
ncbi:hypothetical protein LGL08_22210 [Clostridium estertheticum]|uniref:hypothetical protein n=1 Tax=Clostridium estertheticum TaxID=238834 RepID=UPI001CF2CBD7|nr:hypothetical protein [Clostridium estertheticum]MCB2309249.1 hypothetical protein [Clostridium estertheticum]MCB2346892.1 hypothetical protein [Clostridium estertheticum]MCB2352240.1 hypothetical protein [Clostridium estertheticum]WAG48555.1 hypothetical protein LL127_23590 [Clostridium estertheticum]